MKQCPNCKQFYANDVMFCLSDGTVLSVDSPAAPATSQKNPIWMYIAGGAASLIFGVVIIFTLFHVLKPDNNTNSTKIPETTKTRTSSDKMNVTKINEESELSGERNKRSDIIENQTITESPKSDSSSHISPAGKWKGKWLASVGSSFVAELILKDEGEGKISGKIIWTLRETINPKKMEKIGQSATEYVEGNYDAETRKLTISGYDKDDPYELINLDDYYMTLSSNNRRLGGVAQSRGRLDGRFDLARY